MYQFDRFIDKNLITIKWIHLTQDRTLSLISAQIQEYLTNWFENKEPLKAIYVTFGATIFSALEEDSEIANCDAAKTDYINFISGLGRFTNDASNHARSDFVA